MYRLFYNEYIYNVQIMRDVLTRISIVIEFRFNFEVSGKIINIWTCMVGKYAFSGIHYNVLNIIDFF